MTVTSSAAREALFAAIAARLGDGPALAWLTEQSAAPTVDGARLAMGELPRIVGQRPLIAGFSARETATLDGVYGPMRVGHWRTDEAARTWLLSTVADGAEEPFATLFDLYDLGDTDTRVGALHAVNFVTDADAAQGMALIDDAGRTYLDPLLSTAWCDNPFSAKHLTDTAYHKAVLKALFCEISVDGFIGLEDRATPSLAESLCDFADEREAAGRQVPATVWTVAALHPRPGLVARLIGRLEHPLPDERLVAAKALSNARDARALSFIAERLEREDDPNVSAALEKARAATQAGRA